MDTGMERVSVAERHWMATAKLRALARSGCTLDEIAVINGQETGWTPDRSTVSKRLQALGEEPRHVTHDNLVPWPDILPVHRQSPFLKMLLAEARKRKGNVLSSTDQKYVARLQNVVLSNGLVIGYHQEVGFYCDFRRETDRDIIRFPDDAPASHPANGTRISDIPV